METVEHIGWLHTYVRWIVVIVSLALGSCGPDRRDTSKKKDASLVANIPRSIPLTKKYVVEPKSPVSPEKQTLPQRIKFDLKNRGSRKRRELRYQPNGQHREFTIRGVSSTREINNGVIGSYVQLPTIRIGFSLSGIASKDGFHHYSLRGMPAQVGEEEQKHIAAKEVEEHLFRYRNHVEERRVTVQISDTGTIHKVVPMAATSPGTVRHTRDEVQRMLLEAIVPFPQQAVGKGAVWEVVTMLRRGPAIVRQTANFKLTSFAKDRLSVEIHLRQVGEQQPVTATELPRGVGVELVGLFWEAKGTVEISPHSVTPIKGTLQLELRVHSRLRRGREKSSHFAEAVGTLQLATK